jgi:toxin FitB
VYVLDTNVVAELRKSRGGKADKHVLMWAKNIAPPSLFISAITVLELELGVLLIERRDVKQGAALRGWLDGTVLAVFAGRILAIDAEVARRCAKLHVPDPKSERDALIAATALIHGMTVVTRNVDDFESTGVAIINPWDSAPSASPTRR